VCFSERCAFKSFESCYCLFRQMLHAKIRRDISTPGGVIDIYSFWCESDDGPSLTSFLPIVGEHLKEVGILHEPFSSCVV
jgi:hypothetical protein